jgi:UDP-glucose 4-epimerase
MNTFITGGAGFIGAALIRHLRRSSDRVIVYDVADVGPVEDSAPARFLTIRGDIRDSEALQSALSQARPDLVIHLAAVHHIPFCELNPAIARATNVVGTHHLLNATSRLRSSPAFIFASSAAVYADTGVAVSETSRLGPIDTYGRTKRDAEQLVLDFSESGRLTNCTVLRLPSASSAMLWGVSNCPGLLPGSPQDLSHLPSLSTLAIRELM